MQHCIVILCSADLQVKPVVDISWFSLQLYSLTGRRGMGILYLYSVLGFAVLRGVTPDFGALSKTEHFLEGAFRSVAGPQCWMVQGCCTPFMLGCMDSSVSCD